MKSKNLFVVVVVGFCKIKAYTHFLYSLFCIVLKPFEVSDLMMKEIRLLPTILFSSFLAANVKKNQLTDGRRIGDFFTHFFMLT